MMVEYIIFFAVSASASASPGPAVLLSIKNGATYGLARAFYGVLGNTSANILLAIGSVLGLSTLILTSSTLFFTIKILGGCYLIYLGIKTWSTTKPLAQIYKDADVILPKERNRLSIYQEAFLIGITNPKAIVFFTTLFLQFIDPLENISNQFFTLLIGFSLQSMIFLTFYAALSSKLHFKFKGIKITRWLNKITGAIFIFFGAAVMRLNR